jgi:hypothetical protein
MDMKRKWWDKVGWQGFILFCATLTIITMSFLITGKYNRDLDIIIGLFLGMFLAGEK